MHSPEKNGNLLLKYMSDDARREKLSISFLQKTFFKKEFISEYQSVLHATCSGHKITLNIPAIKNLINCLHNIYISNLNEGVKAEEFSKIFQAFAKSCDVEESSVVLQFFIVLCHLLGLEQKVQFQQSSNPEKLPKSIINGSDFEEAFGVSCMEPNDTSYVIVKSLIRELSILSPHLKVYLGELTYLQWFQSFNLIPIKSEKLLHVHLDFFCAFSDLNTTIIEKNFAKFLTHVLSQPPEAIQNDEFGKFFNLFMGKMLQLYSKLQRIQKFIGKLFLSVQNAKSNLSLKTVLCDNFVSEVSNMITLLPSVQSLSLMEYLLNALEDHCINTLEENSDYVNTLLIQVICALLSAFLRGVRVLSHTTPLGIIKLFLEKMRQLKEMLGRFGKALLVRIHDREIVQPFLHLSYHWGEFELLISYYTPEYAEQWVNKDISPTDLSALHSYLNGEEWNVLAERVSNFGALQCYQFFLKLILQKLRTLQLKKPHTSISGEGTSKYVLTLLTCELYKHDIIMELTPEDITSLLSYLTQRQSRLLIDKLYAQVLESENSEKLLNWLGDSVLLENHNFVVLSIVIIFNKFGVILSELSKENGEVSDDRFSALTLDFVDESYKVNPDELVRLTENLNELLSVEIVKFDNDLKKTKFGILVDAVKCLPLANMPTEICSLVLTGLTFFAVVFSNAEEFVKPLLHLMYKLSMRTGKKETFSNFNIGLGVKWLLQLDSSFGEIRNNFVKLLLKKGISTDRGRDELRQLVRFMRKRKFEEDSRSLEHQITLYQDLGKSWLKTRNECLENREIMKYRNKLSKRIRKTLEKQNELETPTVNPEVLVTAYSIELIRVIKKKEQEDIVRLVHLNFEKFFDIALSQVKAGARGQGYHTFLTNVLLHLSTLKEHLKKNTLKKIWNALKTHPKVDWKLFYRISDDEEFKFFLMDLLKMWKVFEKSKLKRMNLENYFNIWKEFYSNVRTTKKMLYEKYLNRLFVLFSAGMVAMKDFTPEEVVHLFDFVRFCISTSELAMTSPMLDASFDMMHDYNYNSEMSLEEFQKVFESSVKAASWSLTTRTVRMRDKIHNIFQLFTKLLESLVRRSNVILNVTEEELSALSSCSHNMEKWTSKMIRLSKDFSRMSVYFIAALVSSFVKVSVYPAVKAPLVNCIHKFLSISDSHNISHLLMVLNPGSQQVFNGIYETYNRYYKFTGKV